MKGLWLRLFLATAGSTILVWQLYEWLWLPHAYDLESARIETELIARSDALVQQFSTLQAGQWTSAVQAYNRNSDGYLELIDDNDPRWVDLVATLTAKGRDGLYVDGDSHLAVILLADDRSLLRNEVFYFEPASALDAVLWLFIALALLVSGLLLWRVLLPFSRRLDTVSQALDQLFDDNASSSPLTVRGGGNLGEVESGVNRVSEQLNHAMNQWQDSVSAQRDLLHAVAHELRSPIARLRFAQDLLAESTDERERSDLVEKMDVATAELDELVREVLGYSRVRHGGYRLQKVDVYLNDMLEAVCAKVRQVYPLVELVVNDASGRHAVLADERLTERAIINVVRNAARYAVQRVDIDLHSGDGQTRLAIADDGPGIAPGKRERIFEPFTRLDASRSRDSGGSGLGLAIVRAIMRQHGGTVVCEDSEHGGARFVLSWPDPDRFAEHG
jgi:two-component system sensor histidine kinase RstB